MWLRGTCTLTTSDNTAPNTRTSPPDVLVPVRFLRRFAFQHQRVKPVAETKDRVTVFCTSTREQLCGIRNWAKNDGDDSEENHSATKTTGLLVARLRHGLLWYKSTIRQVWLLLLYRWGNYNLGKSKILSKVTQLVGCMAGLYLITCPKGKRIKWSSLWQP